MGTELLVAAVAGVTLGLAGAALALRLLARHLLIVEKASPLGFDETVEGIVKEAEKSGWRVPIVHQLHGSAQEASGHLLLPASVIELSRPDYAAVVLGNDGGRMASSLMPCRVAVYMTADGEVTVSRANTRLLRRMFGGVVSRVMGQATADAEQFVGSALTRT
ncbi:MAG: DUF302 domain-containing protein [Acidobacteria bacterium]|jgi:uncharacterized protein (DUF302 family)|nr:DUF302 domain-containing protein [Acidobacteriota bacterium]